MIQKVQYKTTSLTVVAIVIMAVIFNACSTEKNGWAHKSYHNVVSHYNGYFNAKEIIKEKEYEIDRNFPENYKELLPVFKEPSDAEREGMAEDMDKAIEKCAKVVQKHSINIANEEYTNWIDDSYFMMGVASYYKGDYSAARQIFQYVGKMYRDGNRVDQARLWLVRTYIAQENYEKSESILSLIEGQKEISDEDALMMRKLFTQLYIEKKNYPLAIPELEESIRLSTDKREKARLMYILAQLNGLTDEPTSAAYWYGEVIKLKPSYEMEFYARINRALVYGKDTPDPNALVEELLEMAKDEKNLEYRDQIYYTLGKIEVYLENEPLAIRCFEMSTEMSLNNTNQKGLSFLSLGEIYFANLEYQDAAANYDSCMLYLSEDYPDYETVSKIAANLNAMIEQLAIIAHQDSIQALARMDSTERNEIIQEIIDQKIEEEERRKELEEQDAAAFDPLAPNQGADGFTGMPGAAGGKNGAQWYFYNPSSVGMGAAEFKKLWGTRKNEDHWRRSDKSSIEIEEEPLADGTEGEGFIVNENGDTIAISQDWKEISFYLKDLPLTEEAMAESEDKVEKAYYELGLIYAEELNDNTKAGETFEELLKRFPDTELQAELWYRMYRGYLNDLEYSTSDYYKGLLLGKYPKSDFALMITNPESLEKMNELNIEGEKFYRKTYNMYQRGYYSAVISDCDAALVTYENTPIEPKIALLRAIAYGPGSGEEKVIVELQKVVELYNGTDEGAKAEELIALLNQRTQEKEEAKKKEELLKNTPFKYSPDDEQYVVAMVPKEAKMKDPKISVSDFNRATYRSAGLKTTKVGYNDKYDMVSVQSFKNATKAKEYYDNFIVNTKFLGSLNSAGAVIMIISKEDYSVFYQSKSVEAYDVFFKEHYLK